MRAYSTGKYLASAAAIGVLLCASPGLADDAEKVGLIAALGLQAADGKTTLDAGAGAIEASLLATLLIDQAGAKIAARVETMSNGQKVLVVGKDETVGLFAVAVVKERLQRVNAALARFAKDKKCGGQGSSGGNKFFENLTLKPSDIVAAVATSTNYTPVEISLADRMLLDSVAMHTVQRPRLSYPADIVGVRPNGAILRSYQDMMSAADALRSCPDDADVKAAISVADALAESLTTAPEKGLAPPLIVAAQFEDAAAEGAPAYILRVAIEKQGGTAITRSGIWYTLGFPGAATISAGLIASFRLSDSTTGVVIQSGFVTCAVAPIKLGSVARTVLDESIDLARCRLFAGPNVPPLAR